MKETQENLENVTGEENEEKEFGVLNQEIEVSDKKEYAPLEEGVYTLRYMDTKYEAEGQYGPHFIHRWEEVESGKWVTDVSSLTLSEDSKLYSIFKACGFELTPGGKMNIKDLVGKECMALLIVKTKGDATFNKVKSYTKKK